MATNSNFESSLRKQMAGVEKYINGKLIDYGSDMSTLLAEAYISGAKKRLIERATPRDDQGKAMVKEVANSIHISEGANGLSKTIVVPKGREGLAHFLEYGTGLIGKQESKPKGFQNEINRVGWKYARNKDSYRYGKASPESMSKLGFIFYRGDNYLDKNDINPLYRKSSKYIEGRVYRSYVNGYTDKLGRTRQGYWKTIERKPKDYEYHYWNRQWVLSQGLKPLRYMYDTKVNLNRIIGQYKNKPDGATKLRERLEKYKQNGK